MYRNNNGPFAWVSWAFVTTEEAGGYMEGNFDFKIFTLWGQCCWSG
ncbi:hypothetical protein [Ruegeria lacuscaerulensis]